MSELIDQTGNFADVILNFEGLVLRHLFGCLKNGVYVSLIMQFRRM